MRREKVSKKMKYKEKMWAMGGEFWVIKL